MSYHTCIIVTVASMRGGNGIWMEYLWRSTPTRMPSSMSVGATFSPNATTNFAICFTLMTYLHGQHARQTIKKMYLNERMWVCSRRHQRTSYLPLALQLWFLCSERPSGENSRTRVKVLAKDALRSSFDGRLEGPKDPGERDLCLTLWFLKHVRALDEDLTRHFINFLQCLSNANFDFFDCLGVPSDPLSKSTQQHTQPTYVFKTAISPSSSAAKWAQN